MDITRLYLFLCSLLTHAITAQDTSIWEDWWSYEGISGPGYWGLLNIDWTLCNKGRNQSPINIDPKTLLFDPSLGPIVIEGDRIHGHLQNNGHDITLKVANNSPRVNVTEGPLSYKYVVQQIRIHFHTEDDLGSEHTIDGKSFPAEIQIFAYNTDLYNNMSTAKRSPRGLTIIAVFAQITERPHSEFGVLLKAMNKTKYKGDVTLLRGLQLSRLLPATDNYVTYEGSMTHPGCFETVTWLVLNKPIHVSKKQIEALRVLNQATRDNPRMLMAGNIRPDMPLNQRTVRTNINFVCPACETSRVGQMMQSDRTQSRSCSMGKDMFYKVNERFKEP
ncbi:carbonic anhydrase-related protein 10-like isoform X1 [Haliotis rufescens]|uniref:carbonic anhydrase-related protein 10-like isoform X1 n=1 Tax=Haliotis rufescens TaxID=6454 RepID=UPI001EB03B22|nr:carbonic anhydrase-related protein 10-like isoform X1 [Haliotis rufescens]XP_046339951.1 carbonic anhydrase-related protein 10-like isoform X1 [Haliotis rufescens]XP_046339952.1 carbonic anhydrase-related protein 10-like isoform X1 [Haliotis rufescens]